MAARPKTKPLVPAKKGALRDLAGYPSLRDEIAGLLQSARQTAARTVNALMTATCWEIGRRVVEAEQQGNRRAEYGQRLIERLSDDLSTKFGRGFSSRNLEQMRMAYLVWPISQTLSALSLAIVKAVEEPLRPTQMELEGVTARPDFAAVVAKTVELVTQQTIEIPRILVVPKGKVKSGFKPFSLKLDTLKYPAVSDELWIQHLRTNQLEVVTLGAGGLEERRLEDYVVSGLVNFDDVSYDDQADLLYDLASQTVRHFMTYLSEDDTRKVLRCYQRDITRFIHVQMQEHSWEEVVEYEVVVSKGFTELKPSAYNYSVNEPPADYRVSPDDKSNMSKYVFGGFKRCLYPIQKFDSEAERVLAVILERDALKWFKPAKGQFQILYGLDHLEYQPDFVAETDEAIYMLEPKASNQMTDPIVLAKKESAIKWCKSGSDYAKRNGGKPWRYVLIPHNAIAVNMMLDGLAGQFGE